MSTLREGAWRGGEGMRLLMLTGDNPESAAAIARDVGLPAEDVNAGLTPGISFASSSALARRRRRIRR